ncbi:hypothetical protein FSP39_005648 [Pinctada imbricata]|uniref:Trafficking protein particle complex subunit 8 n=1 Tax=Pinctada imbricata TaxID=66713 RepID=A0AA88XQG4_PINIB|nr:hypothetical protein FSP39_005648 [Pinctada imbricata]
MALCKQAAQDFIQNTFSPNVAVLCSPDAEILCQKNNLTFVDLVQPFCRLTTEAHIRDPHNATHTIRNLKISMRDMSSHLPQQAMARKMMNDVVANSQPQLLEGGRGNVVTIGDYDLQLTSSTPWFEAYRETFLRVLPPSDQEFLNDCLGLSSGHTDPINAFNTLNGQQHQQQTQYPNKVPRWFCPAVLKYFVLLHDVCEGEDAKYDITHYQSLALRADAIYQSMKSTYGASVCHLLHINSRSLHTAETLKIDSNLPDPWSQFLNKNNSETNNEGADYEIGTSGIDDAGFPSKVSEGTGETNVMNSSQIIDISPDSGEGSASTGSLASETFDHPLAMTEHTANNTNHLDSPTLPTETTVPDINHTHQPSKGKQPLTSKNGGVGGHGMCLTTSDHDRLKIFMHEFCIRALLPWAEKQMRQFNDQLTSRKGIHRSIFSGAKRWFGGNKPSGQVAASQNTTVVYSSDAPELQMRRLADLAFLFHMYDFAHHTYHAVKRDFNNDNAWLHFAGALEMASISLFMANPREQKYPYHYMETAITTYLQTCKNPLYATRATLVSTEALKSRLMHHEAAQQFIKLTSEDSDLRSALLLEQAAHCYINMEVPKVRKYAFHMILAGHRFSKTGQRKHALRAYSQALQVYKGKKWSLAEDHINFTIGRQSFNLKQLENATAAFKHLLTENSKQSHSHQSSFLREYLFVYKQLLSQEASTTVGLHSGPLPELPIPVIDSNSTKVILGNRSQHSPDQKALGSGAWFDHGESNHPRWSQLEEALVMSANDGSLPINHRPTLQCHTSKTDNRHSPIGYVGEPVTIEIHLVNPLKVMLILTEVTILWRFLPTIHSQDKAQPISNEAALSAKNSLADEIIHTQVIEEIILQGNDRSPVQISLVPQQTGELRVVGICYNLGSVLTEGNGLKPTPSNTVFVRGKQKLEVQGPRLNSTKEEKSSKMYGPDRRLDLVIKPEMPQLQVSVEMPQLQVTFCNFPGTLLCGEVHAVMLQFTNIGSSPLHKLKLASTNPEFITLGGHGEPPKFPSVYQNSLDVPNYDSCSCRTSKDKNSTKSVVDIDLPNGILQPKCTISIPAWVRGNDIGGIHDVHFMFYYEPVQGSQKVGHRLQRHTAVVNTLESLSVRVIARRGDNTRSPSHSGSCVLSCELENISQIQSQKAHVKEIQINQVSCASNLWSVMSLSTQHKTEIQIGSRETMQLCLKAVQKNSDLGKLIYCNEEVGIFAQTLGVTV